MASPQDETAFGEVTVSADGKNWRNVSPVAHSIDVEDHEFLTDKATILLDDHTGVLAHASFEGLELRVRLGPNETTSETIFEGVVASARAVTSREGPQVELTALDFTYRMSRNRPQGPPPWDKGEKLSDVIKQIVDPAKNYGISIISEKQIAPTVDVTFTKDNPLSQGNKSDAAFIQHLADRYNCRSFVEFDGKESSLFYFVAIKQLADAAPIMQLQCCRGLGGLISFDFERISSGALVELTGASIDFASGETVTYEPEPAPPLPPVPAPATERDRDLSSSRREAVQSLTELAAKALAQIEIDRKRVIGEESDPAAAAGRVFKDPTRSKGLKGTGVANGTPKLRAKYRIKISGIAPWAEGEWYVTKVNHVYTRQRLGGRQSTSYVSNFKATM
jgi:phage protein D